MRSTSTKGSNIAYTIIPIMTLVKLVDKYWRQLLLVSIISLALGAATTLIVYNRTAFVDDNSPIICSGVHYHHQDWQVAGSPFRSVTGVDLYGSLGCIQGDGVDEQAFLQTPQLYLNLVFWSSAWAVLSLATLKVARKFRSDKRVSS